MFVWTPRKHFRKHFYKTLPRVRKCFIQSPKESEDFFSWKKLFFIKVFVWTRRKQLWQRKNSTKFKRFSTQSPKNEVFKKYIYFIKVLAWRRKKHIWKYFYKTLPKVIKCFMQSPKESEDFFREKNCFSSKCSYERVESKLDNFAKRNYLPKL